MLMQHSAWSIRLARGRRAPIPDVSLLVSPQHDKLAEDQSEAAGHHVAKVLGTLHTGKATAERNVSQLAVPPTPFAAVHSKQHAALLNETTASGAAAGSQRPSWKPPTHQRQSQRLQVVISIGTVVFLLLGIGGYTIWFYRDSSSKILGLCGRRAKGNDSDGDDGVSTPQVACEWRQTASTVTLYAKLPSWQVMTKQPEIQFRIDGVTLGWRGEAPYITAELYASIILESCTYSVTGSDLIVRMNKLSEEHWPRLTFKEDDSKAFVVRPINQ